MADLVIRNGYVVTMNPERRIYADGAVAVEGSRIVDVGPTADVVSRQTADDIVDAVGMMVIPGLIDGHNHPFAYLIGSLVYAANGCMFDTVITDGGTVIRGREVLTIDEEKISRDVVAAGKAWMERAGVRPRCPWPVHA